MSCCWKMLLDHVCLRAKCTKLGLGLWPGQSFSLDPTTTSRPWCNGTFATGRNSHDASVAITKLLPWENSKLKMTQVSCKPNWPCQISTEQCPMLPLGAKERVSRAGDGCSSGDLELIKASSNSYTIYSPFLSHLHFFSSFFISTWGWCSGDFSKLHFDFDEPCWALHSLGGDFKSLGKTWNQQQVMEPFWYHCKPFDLARSEANLTTTPLEPLNGAWICRS